MLECIGSGQPGAGFEYLIAEAIALTKQQQVLPVKFVRSDGGPLSPGMSGRNDNAERLFIDRLGNQTRLGKWQRDDDDVQFHQP